MKCALVLIASLLSPAAAAGLNPSFTPLDIWPGGHLVFTGHTSEPGRLNYTTLLDADLNEEDSIRVLTHFPEHSAYYPDTGEIEIQNRYGLYRGVLDSPSSSSARKASISMEPAAFHPAFSRGARLPAGRTLPASGSPNGRWIVIQEPDTSVRGSLVLHDTRGGDPVTVCPDHLLDYRDAPVIWSPDSRYLIYARDGRIYYLAVHRIEDIPPPDESYRELGSGTLAAVRWDGADSLYFLSGRVLRRLKSSNFFPLSLYSRPLITETAMSAVPIDFDPRFDRFWPSPDGGSLLILKNGRALFRFHLSRGDSAPGAAQLMPFLLLPEGTGVLDLWWRPRGDIFVLTGGGTHSGIESALYHLPAAAGGDTAFIRREISDLRRLVPSPDGGTIAMLDSKGVSLRASNSLSERMYINHPDPRNLLWIGDNRLVILGGRHGEMIRLPDRSSDIITLSSVDQAGFDGNGAVTAVSAGRRFRLEGENRIWLEKGGALRSPRLQSHSHRVYSEDIRSSYYRNRIMLRSTGAFGNRPLFPSPPVPSSPSSESRDAMLHSAFDSRIFDHGSRSTRRVSLVFNLVDDNEGFAGVLGLLADYRIRSTFFVGGDFIRRNPDSVRALESSPHEIGSLFYTNIDLTDQRYRIDTDFIVRGMGRNEDEFFRAAGGEVSTLWHAPWYVVTPSVLDATERMGYLYVGRDVDPMDWVSRNGEKGASDAYKPSSELARRVLDEVRPGSIVPIRIGQSVKRDDYLFQYLDLIINGLLNDGYEIVAVGELIGELEGEFEGEPEDDAP